MAGFSVNVVVAGTSHQILKFYHFAVGRGLNHLQKK